MEIVKLGIIFLMVLTIVSALPFQNLTVKAQEPGVGVNVGDYFKYGTFDGSVWPTMSPPSAPMLMSWKDYANTSTITFTVNTVSPPGLNYTRTVTYHNGTLPQSQTGWVNVLLGNGMGALFFSPAGLDGNMHNRVYPHNSNITWTLNSTFIDHSNWNGRTLNVLNITVVNPVKNSSSPFAYRQSVTWWDKETGVLVSEYESAAGTNIHTGVYLEGRLLYQLIATNKFQITYTPPMDLTPIFAIMGSGAVIALVVVMIRYTRGSSAKEYKQKKERRKSRT